MLIAKPLVLLFLLQQAGAKPPRTTFEKLQAGAHRPGVRVEVAAVVLPTSASQVQSGATIRYFALAVPAHGTFFKDAARALEEVKAAAPEAIKQLEAAVDDDASFKTKLDEVDKLESRLSKLAPAAAEALAVELPRSPMRMTRSVAAILAAAGASLGAGSVPADDVARLARASNVFAFDLYKEVRKGSGNQIVAPASLSTALTMAWAGARGTTADEMKRVLHLDLAPAAATKASGTLTAALTDPQRPVVLRIANRLFGEKTYRFEPGYIEATRAAFGASLEPMDFRVASEASRGSINGWVEAQTEKRIANLIPPGGVDPQTRLVLVNAVYFLGGWDEAFQPKATGPEPFHTSKTAVKDVPTMHRSGTIASFQSESAGLQAIELPYKGRGLSMVIVLPDAVDGIAAVETRLTAAVFDTIVANLHNGQVSLSLPRFEVAPAASLSLASTLAALGMPAAFDRDKADFTGIANPADPRDRLFIGAAFHKAFVKADENGTEAAAASALSMTVRGGGPPRVVEFKADHPFLFFIRDTATGLILFMGRVTDPGAP